MRLDKALTYAGLTRSQAKKAIAGGRARVRGEIERDAGADVMVCDVTLDGAPIEGPRAVTLMMHKPAGYLTAMEDARDKTVADLLPEAYHKYALGPVGRLDKDVTGLILLTTDGTLAHRLIAPKRNVEKVYEAQVEGDMDEGDIAVIEKGIAFRDFTARPAQVAVLGPGRVRLTLTEGKYHEVKRICAHVGHPVAALKRISIGGVALDPALPEGECRELTSEELQSLYGAAGMEEQI